MAAPGKLAEVRSLIGQLILCEQFIQNPRRKEEIKKIIQQLREREDSLFSKDNMLNWSYHSQRWADPTRETFYQVAPTDVNDFRVSMEHKQHMRPSQIQQLAVQQGVQNPYAATQAVQQSFANTQFAEAKTMASFMVNENDALRALTNQTLTETELRVHVEQIVQREPSIRADLAPMVTDMIVQHLLQRKSV